MAPHTLSDGTYLPKSTIIGMASGPMARSPQYHASPETFDGLRFHRMRVKSGDMAAHQFTTTGLGSLMFGHGKHACPGRFFASVESKIVLVHILQRYDLGLREGEGRPKNLLLGDANITDYTAAIEIRARQI
jgi:cytochrome P450